MNTTPAATEPRPDSSVESALETRLKKMLKDGLCDLYDVVAVLQGLGRLPMDVPDHADELKAALEA